MAKLSVTNTFLIVMAIASIIGYLVIAINGFFNIDIGDYTAPVLLIILGVALLIQGQVKFWWRYIRDGRLTSNEFTSLVTGIIGFLAVVSGILAYFIKESVTFNVVQGILAIIAIIVIIVDVFLTN